MLTRRSVLVAGAALAAAGPARAAAAPGGDADVLARALRLEDLVHAGLTAGIVAGAPAPRTARRLAEVTGHDLRHARVLAEALEALGARRPRVPRDVSAVERLAAAVGAPPLEPALGDERDLLAWGIEVKRRAVDGYADAAARLLDLRLTQTVATIAAAEGQHLAVLRRALGGDPVPRFLETRP